ncbi:MAG: LPS assembly lipoprotein LptE [Thermodesulfobacteriota bacterium]|nr:LPS assembly lipoprotein LptE [Thermodesulfobacteriota bacterium]
MNQRSIWLLVATGLFICACGYRFPGGGEIPGGIRAVSIPLFVNRTNEVGLENTITNDLTNEFIIRRKKALADNDETADGILYGEIASVLTRTITQTEAGGSVEREVIVGVDLKLTNKKDQVIWATRSVTARETYDVGASSLATEINRREAIQQLSVRLAEKIYNRLIEDF